MTELLNHGRGFEFKDEESESQPSFEAQCEFFRAALLESIQSKEQPRLIRGPYYSDFIEIMDKSGQELRAVDPNLTPEFIKPREFMSAEALEVVEKLPEDTRIQLNNIQSRRANALRNFALEQSTPALSQQSLDQKVLSVPPFCSQKDDWLEKERLSGCANACFRMVFGAITGWRPSQTLLSEGLIEQCGTSIVDDTIYSNLYNTKAFKEVCPRSVVTVEVIGADFDFIKNLTARVKNRNAKAEVYSIVSLASKAAKASIWHSCVLLEADGRKVTYHEPLDPLRGASTKEPVKDFARRWAGAYNRAQLVIAA